MTGGRRRRASCGLTVIELMLALAGTALIGSAIASMMFGIRYGTSSSRELRELAVKNKALSARIAAAVRGSGMVLDAGDDYVVLWTYDLDGDGTPSAKELRRIGYSAAAQTILDYAPADDAGDDELALESDFEAATDALIAAGELVGVVWAQRVSAWEVTLDADDPQAATMLGFRLTLTAGNLGDVAIAVISLRN